MKQENEEISNPGKQGFVLLALSFSSFLFTLFSSSYFLYKLGPAGASLIYTTELATIVATFSTSMKLLTRGIELGDTPTKIENNFSPDNEISSNVQKLEPEVNAAQKPGPKVYTRKTNEQLVELP